MEKVKDKLNRRNLSTAKPLFTQITNRNCSRQLKTSNNTRMLPRVRRGGSHVLDCSKESIQYQNYLTKVNSFGKIDEKIIVSNCLSNLRKQYDQMAKVSHRQSSAINLMKRDIDFLKKKYNEQKKDNDSWQKRYTNVKQQTQTMQKKQKDIKMQTRTLYHIMQRMKKDQIYYKNILRQKQLICNEKKRIVKEKKQQLIECDQLIHKQLLQVQKLQEIFSKNHSFRTDKFQDYCEKIQHLQDKQKFMQQRQQRTYQLLNIQSNDILHDKNIIARQIAIANKLADCILQNQINSLLKKYSNLQNSFHIIKTKTNINQPYLLTTKFFSYGQLSTELMRSISSSEKYFQKLSSKNHQLNQKYKSLLNKYYQQQIYKSQPHQTIAQQKTKISTQTIQKSLLIQRLKSWIDRKCALLKVNQKQNQNSSFQIKFSALCTKLAADITQFESKQNLKDRKYQNNGIIIKKLVKELTIEQQTKRMSQMQEIAETNSIERLFLLEERNHIKRSHSKLEKMY